MKRTRTLACLLSVAGLALAGAAVAQEPKKPATPKKAEVAKKAEAPKAAEAPPEPPKPGPEHNILKQDAGTWDATVEMTQGPGQAPMVSKGVEINTLLGGGLWLVTDFKSDMMGQPFEGHGISGYDSGQRKYVSTWVDSWSTGLSSGQSTYDAAARKMTGWMEGPDMTGQISRTTMVTEWKDLDTRVFTMSGPGPDGKEFAGLKITYKRRK